MTSLLKTVILLTVVTAGTLSLSTQSASAVDVEFDDFPLEIEVPQPVQVPEPGAIAPLALLGAALIFCRKSTHSDAA